MEYVSVYLVDDSAIIRSRLLTLFSEIEGLDVIGQAGNAFIALKEIRELHPDLVILDVQMTGMSGIELLPQIKGLVPSPIVIMLTNFPFPQYRARCKEHGCDYFFDKSKETDEMLDVIQGLVEGMLKHPEGTDSRG